MLNVIRKFHFEYHTSLAVLARSSIPQMCGTYNLVNKQYATAQQPHRILSNQLIRNILDCEWRFNVGFCALVIVLELMCVHALIRLLDVNRQM